MVSLIEEVGAFNKFQKLILPIIGLVSIIPSFGLYAPIFSVAEPDLECHQSIYQKEPNITVDYSKYLCNIWNNYTSLLSKNETSLYECKFDKTYYGTTLITDWNLICDKKEYGGYTQSLYLFGVLFSCINGPLVDSYGRKKIALITIVSFAVVSGITNSLITGFVAIPIFQKYIVYGISQFLNGCLITCMYNSTFTLINELVSHDYHTLVSNFMIYFYIIGELVTLLVYYLTRSWVALNWFIVAYSTLVIFLFAFFVPESPKYRIILL